MCARLSRSTDWDGGVVLVSHDFRLISQVAREIYECKDGQVTKWHGTISDYKAHLRRRMGLD